MLLPPAIFPRHGGCSVDHHAPPCCLEHFSPPATLSAVVSVRSATAMVAAPPCLQSSPSCRRAALPPVVSTAPPFRRASSLLFSLPLSLSCFCTDCDLFYVHAMAAGEPRIFPEFGTEQFGRCPIRHCCMRATPSPQQLHALRAGARGERASAVRTRPDAISRTSDVVGAVSAWNTRWTW